MTFQCSRIMEPYNRATQWVIMDKSLWSNSRKDMLQIIINSNSNSINNMRHNSVHKHFNNYSRQLCQQQLRTKQPSKPSNPSSSLLCLSSHKILCLWWKILRTSYLRINSLWVQMHPLVCINTSDCCVQMISSSSMLARCSPRKSVKTWNTGTIWNRHSWCRTSFYVCLWLLRSMLSIGRTELLTLKWEAASWPSIWFNYQYVW